MKLCTNPHWIGDEPAWDINLSNGVTHKSVTKGQICSVLAEMHNKGLISNGERYVDCVRECHIQNYDKWFSVRGIES